MKRRLTLAFGCLACAVPSMAPASSSLPRTINVATVATKRLTLLGATQVAQRELERRGLAAAHSIASVVLLPGVTPDSGHFDVRIDPPAMQPQGERLRGFSVAIDGTLTAVTGFRVAAGYDAGVSQTANKSDKSEADLASSTVVANSAETPEDSANSSISTP